MINKYDKKGITQDALVTTILIVLGGILIGAIMLKVLGVFPTTFTQEACHTSVMTRGQDIMNLPIGKALTDLKCKTQKKCITMGGDCPTGFDKVSVSNDEDIRKEIAGTMYDCWYMLGEGQYNFFSTKALEQKNCVFCSILHFDSEIQKKYPQLGGLETYMMTHQIPGKNQDYLSYIFGSSAQKEVKPIIVDTTQEYVVNFMMTNQGWLTGTVVKAVAAGGTVALGLYAAGAVGTGGIGLLAAPIILAATKYAVTGELVWIGFGMVKQTPVGAVVFTLTSFNADSIKEFGCEKIESIR